jgi:hypothetical protein
MLRSSEKETLGETCTIYFIILSQKQLTYTSMRRNRAMDSAIFKQISAGSAKETTDPYC